MSIVCDLSY